MKKKILSVVMMVFMTTVMQAHSAAATSKPRDRGISSMIETAGNCTPAVEVWAHRWDSARNSTF